jgi:tetratricopeptide (TPR) repeat protein
MVRKLRVAILAVVFVGPFFGWRAAQGADMPSPGYYDAYRSLCDGDYLDALRAFQSAGRGAYKVGQTRWIDSICYEAMCGECYFQMGVLDRALAHYTNALQLYQQYPDWLLKVQFNSPTISTAPPSARKLVPWGSSTRPSKLGSYPASEKILQVMVDANQTIKRGTVVQQGYYYRISPQEVIRATTLALRRRATLLGPAGKFDPLSNSVTVSLNRSVGPPNHWSGAYVDLERALALIQGGREGQAVGYLKRSLLAAGEYDHPLTSISLLELGRLALLHADFQAASRSFEEATYAAVNYPDYGVLEEAFRYGTVTHLMSNGKGFFKPLGPAIPWAKSKGLRQLQASLLLCAAESYAAIGETRQAAAAIDEARIVVGNRKMGSGLIGARLSYLTAQVAFQQRRNQEGNKALEAAMGYMEHGSLRLFHVGLADGLYTNGVVTSRSALELFGEVLRDPSPTDWGMDPMESLSVMMTPQPSAMEHWFEAAVERRELKELQTAMDIAERIRRRRFLGSLELGGRLEAFRWVLEAPVACLPQQALLQRQDFLARHPEFEQISRKSQTIRESLGKLPLVAADQPALKEQTRQLGELASLGARQEDILRVAALQREPADLVFPPLRTVADVQKSLPDKHAVMVFFATGRNLYGFLLNKDRFSYWRVNSPATLSRQIQGMLRDLGQAGQNHEVSVKDLADPKWKLSARQVLDSLLKNSPADFSQPFEELAIVPDGVLWYLPFEALQVKVGQQSYSLISRFRIRYAPMLSLCIPQGPGRGAGGNTAVVVGKLYPRDDAAVAKAAFDQIAEAIPHAAALRTPPPAPSSIYGTLFQRLIVLDDLASSERGPYGWALAPVDRGKPGSSLADWFALPWGGPEVVVLPGFHTAAEESYKRPRHGLPGNEVFLSVCGLMANGSRTMLFSRWRTGGQTSFDLVREFVQELPHASPAEAWQRAVLLAIDSRLSFDSEPRVKHASSDEAPKASHPFFWAGYMLVDSGTATEPAQATDGPVIKLKKPDKAAEEKPKDEAPNDQKTVESPKGETDGESPKDETKDETAPKKPVKKKPKSKAKSKIEK